MSLAFELGPRVVIVQCPKLPGEGEQERANLLARGPDSTSAGTATASDRCSPWRSGSIRRRRCRDYLDTFDVGSLKVNYDPANLLVNGFDPVKGIIPLHRRIAHVHARDARRSTVSRGAQEVPLGAGDVDWLSFVGVAGGDRVSRLADDRTRDGGGSAQGRGARGRRS